MVPASNRGPRTDPRRQGAARVALIYALVGSLWILGSDWLLGKLVRDPAWVVQIGAIKGWLFIAVTAALLYLLVRRIPSGAKPPVVPEKLTFLSRLRWALLYVSILGLT